MDHAADVRLPSATRRHGHDEDAPGGTGMGDSQAAQLIVFVLATTVLLVALEVGLRRTRRRR